MTLKKQILPWTLNDIFRIDLIFFKVDNSCVFQQRVSRVSENVSKLFPFWNWFIFEIYLTSSSFENIFFLGLEHSNRFKKRFSQNQENHKANKNYTNRCLAVTFHPRNLLLCNIVVKSTLEGSFAHVSPKKGLHKKSQVHSSKDNGFSEAVCLTFNDNLRKIKRFSETQKTSTLCK